MSADNWTICPKCAAKHQSDFAKKREKVQASYGKIPAAQFIIAMDEVETTPRLEETLREDYCQGMSIEGIYSLEYGCSCRVCDFSFSKKIEEQTKIT